MPTYNPLSPRDQPVVPLSPSVWSYRSMRRSSSEIYGPRDATSCDGYSSPSIAPTRTSIESVGRYESPLHFPPLSGTGSPFGQLGSTPNYIREPHSHTAGAEPSVFTGPNSVYLQTSPTAGVAPAASFGYPYHVTTDTSQPGRQEFGNSSDPHVSQSPEQLDDPTKMKKLRNLESARRTRKRKEVEMNRLKCENDALREKVAKLTNRVHYLEGKIEGANAQ